MSIKSTYEDTGDLIKFTAAAALTAGDIITEGGWGVQVVLDVANGDVGSARTSGRITVIKTEVAIAEGAGVYWDADGTPTTGVAGEGAAEGTAASNGAAMGVCLVAAGTNTTTVEVLLGATPVFTTG